MRLYIWRMISLITCLKLPIQLMKERLNFFLISLFFLVWSDQALSLSVNNDEIFTLVRIAQYGGSDSPLIIPSLSISYYTQIIQYFCQIFVTSHFWEQFWVMFQMPSADMSGWFRVLWIVLSISSIPTPQPRQWVLRWLLRRKTQVQQ